MDRCILNFGEKGSGKSTVTIMMVKEYLEKFSFICPHCGSIFYKNLYAKEATERGYRFYIPEEIRNNQVYIKCPEYFELDLKTGLKNKVSGCGNLFPYSQRKKVKYTSEKFIAYDNAQMYKMLLKSPIGSPLIADEAINFCSSLDFNKAESKELKRLFAVVRPRRYLVFLNVPEILWVDRRYREDMSHFTMWEWERGETVILEKNKSVSDDKYDLKTLKKIMPVLKHFTPQDKIKRALKRHPCYFDSFHFDELDEKTYADYEYYRNARNLQIKIEEMQFSNKDLAKVLSWQLLTNWDSVNVEVARSKEHRMTYALLTSLMRNPLTQKPLVSEPTLRSWIRGLDEYIKSQGKDVNVFANAPE